MLRKLPDVEITSEVSAKLKIYENQLLKWQKSINLVSANTLNDVKNRHFIDSLQIAGIVSREAKILDIGSGAGFPGLVLAALGYEVDLIESDIKKSQFLKHVSREANIPVTIHNLRIVSVNNLEPDIITARALADLTKLLEITEKWWSINKKINLIFLKGKNTEIEIAEAQKIYQFDCDVYKSNTDPLGRILKLTNIHRIP